MITVREVLLRAAKTICKDCRGEGNGWVCEIPEINGETGTYWHKSLGDANTARMCSASPIHALRDNLVSVVGDKEIKK